MTEVRYVPGAWTAVAFSRHWLLIDAAPDSVQVREVWQRMDQARGFESVLTSLLRFGFDQVPDFVLLTDEGDQHVLICRGQGGATFAGGGAPGRVEGTGLATWREYTVPEGVEQVILGRPPASATSGLPALAGVFLADSIIVSLAADTAAAPAAAPDPDAGRDADTVTAEPPRQAGRISRAQLLPEPPEPPGQQPPRDPPAQLPSPATATRPDTMPVELPPAPAILRAPAPAPATETNEDTGYDFLFAATRAQSVEGAAIRPPASPLTPGGLIDSVPWAAKPAGFTPAGFAPAGSNPPGTGPAAPGTFAAEPAAATTIRRADLAGLGAGPGAGLAPPDRIGPTVHALLCPSSHANPPSNSSCRICGAALPPQNPVVVTRPVLGVLRLFTGDVITLDRGVVMGRNPTTEFEGNERPHVVKLPGGDGEISRTHLKITLDGWHVLVTDLKSTNGTLVGLPGRAAERLRPNEPLPIQPGTVVTLADGIDFRFEVGNERIF